MFKFCFSNLSFNHHFFHLNVLKYSVYIQIFFYYMYIFHLASKCYIVSKFTCNCNVYLSVFLTDSDSFHNNKRNNITLLINIHLKISVHKKAVHGLGPVCNPEPMLDIG